MSIYSIGRSQKSQLVFKNISTVKLFKTIGFFRKIFPQSGLKAFVFLKGHSIAPKTTSANTSP